MSLDKAILHKQVHRKKYYGAKAIARSCRNHGSCPWCQRNRQHSSLIRKDSLKDQESDLWSQE